MSSPLRTRAQHVFLGHAKQESSVSDNVIAFIRQLGESAAQSPLLALLATIGFISIFLTVARLAYVLVDLYVLPGIPLSRFGAVKPTASNAAKKGKQRSWAVVTGATDGIGREFAVQLAGKGFNVFLASRTPEKLEQVANEIEQTYEGIKTRIHAIDFSAGDEKQYAALASAIDGLDIGVLVNNVGASHDMPVPFEDTPEEEMLRIAELNVKATLRVTRIVTPLMVRQKRGLVLNVGSFAGQFPVPLLATYAGTKAFLISFAQALGEELRRKNIVVQTINAYFIVSKLSKIRRASSMIPTPKAYVKQVLLKIGRSGGAAGRPFNMTPWPAHGLMDWAITTFLLGSHWLLRYNYDNSLSIRKRALKKAAKAQ